MQRLKDSLTQRWEDSIQIENYNKRKEDFSKNRNLELIKKQKRPLALTIFILLILFGVALRYAFFKNQIFSELSVFKGAFALNEWLSSKRNIVDVYHLFSRILNYLLLTAIILVFLKTVSKTDISAELLIKITLAITLISVIRHLLAFIFSSLIQRFEFFQLHFNLNHLITSLTLVLNTVCLTLLYFSNSFDIKNWLLVTCASILLISWVVYFIIFAFKSILSPSIKNVYLIFYLCTFEILPIIVGITWLAKTQL